MLRDILRVARKETGGFFASPAAFLFLGAFLLATLFVFFWLDAFFARNIADVQPLFKWLPVLLIFLVAALTMRTWSEERRAGTLESLLTSPVSTFSLVLGKFLAGLALVAVALLLTLPLPITVSFLGQLDWGPVIGGYIATLFLASAYLAIGQTMSARTDNPVVALILTAVVCGVFYLIGAEALTSLFGVNTASVMALIGTGSRFDSITRGVIDLRDIYYYLSLVGFFLTLNLFSLERIRWAGNPGTSRHRAYALIAGLTAVNFVAANFWLAPIGSVRADITADHMYSLSAATRSTLAEAREPLVIKAYFSSQTHPLLAPLVPQLRDLLKEYAIAGGHNVRVEFINPQEDKAKEEEAAGKYGIQPVPFQVANKYQAGVVSTYFDVVVAYGDQFEKLGFRDLIEVKSSADGQLEVALRDPEYSITRAVRKVIAGYQAGGSPFSGIQGDVAFKGYISPDDRLPDVLKGLRKDLDAVLADLGKESGGHLKVDIADPDANGGALGRTLTQRYGYQPQVASLVDPRPFWFYMALEGKSGVQQIAFPSELNRDALRRSIVAALQRMGSGALKTVALYAPGDPQQGQSGYARLRQSLADNARVVDTDLSSGQVPSDADLLMVLAPHDLNPKQLFAIDQFLMQGGSVVMATSPYNVSFTDQIFAAEQHTGLEDWLKHLGIGIDKSLVLDARNAALPIPVTRYVGGIAVRDMQMLPYPPFPDVRGAQLSTTNPITANLNQLTFNWVSPLNIDAAQQKGRKWDVLAKSSPDSWHAPNNAAMPNFRAHPDSGFAPPDKRVQSTLAVALEGRFESYFKGKPSPLVSKDDKQPAVPGASAPAAKPEVGGVIDHSPDSARLVLVSSNNFGDDMTIGITSGAMGTIYTAPLTFLQNAVDWSLEDRSLLALRGRTHFARTLEPLDRERQQFWETLNYALAIAGLVVVWLVRRGLRAARNKRHSHILKEVSA